MGPCSGYGCSVGLAGPGGGGGIRIAAAVAQDKLAPRSRKNLNVHWQLPLDYPFKLFIARVNVHRWRLINGNIGNFMHMLRCTDNFMHRLGYIDNFMHRRGCIGNFMEVQGGIGNLVLGQLNWAWVYKK